MLCRAYSSDPLHPGVLNMLAHFSLLRGDLDQVVHSSYHSCHLMPYMLCRQFVRAEEANNTALQAKSIASAAFEASQVDQARAQSFVILARASHGAGAVQEAFRYYSQAGSRVLQH